MKIYWELSLVDRQKETYRELSPVHIRPLSSAMHRSKHTIQLSVCITNGFISAIRLCLKTCGIISLGTGVEQIHQTLQRTKRSLGRGAGGFLGCQRPCFSSSKQTILSSSQTQSSSYDLPFMVSSSVAGGIRFLETTWTPVCFHLIGSNLKSCNMQIIFTDQSRNCCILSLSWPQALC